MNALDESVPSLPAWKPKEVAVSDSEDDDSSSSSSDDEGLDSFDANPSNNAQDGFEFDEEDSFVATAEDVAAWEAGLAAPPRPRHRELRLADGGRYSGETLGGLMHGRGTLECPNGDKYEGGWRLGLRHGRGKAVFPSRKKKTKTKTKEGEAEEGGEDVSYDGEWVDDKADGQGRATYENGGVYEGAFSKGVRCGWGRHTFPAPAVAAAAAAAASSSSSRSASPPPPRPTYYEGEWLDDAPHGRGVHFCPVRGTFVGCWERGSRSKGCWTSADGEEEYEGDWAVVAAAVDAAAVADDEADAAGKSSSSSSSSSNPLDPLTAAVRHGKGTCTLRGVSKYSGDWRRGEPWGPYGECRYADGSVFTGGWRRGRRHGPAGELRRPDGSFYVGEWREGFEHGRGRALLPCGDEYEGEWERGRRHGRGGGTCGPRSGDSYAGEWRAGERHGFGKCTFANGDVYEGQWERGERHGMGTCVFKEDGVRFEGAWQRGRWVQGAADAALSEPVSSEEERERGRENGVGGNLHFLRAVAGRRSSFRIRAKDAKGQPRLSGGDCFVAWVECGFSSDRDEGEGGRGEKGGGGGDENSKALVDPAARAPSPSSSSSSTFERVDARVADRGDGTYDVSYVPRVAGEARLHVSLLSSSASSSLSSLSSSSPPPSSSSPSSPSFVPVADSPYTLLVEPGPPQKRQELVLGLPREIQQGNNNEEEEKDKKRITFWVQPRDEFGNACGPCPSAFAVAAAVARVPGGGSSSSSSLEVHAETRQLPDGRVECSFPPAAFAAGSCPLGRGVVEVMVVDSASAAASVSATPRHARGSPFSLNVVDAPSPSSSSSSDSPASASTSPPRVEDKAAAWSKAAEEAFLAVDGDATGWASDDCDGDCGVSGKKGGGRRRRSSKSTAAAGEEEEDSAESLAAAHPGVPIVERLEDIWQVAKLHRERKEKEKEKEQEEKRKKKNRRGGEGGEESEEEEEEDESDALGAAQAAAKAAEDSSRAAVAAAAAAAAAEQEAQRLL